VSDLQDREANFISKCGALEVTFDYDMGSGKMTVTVHQARDIPSKERGGASSTQVRLLLLPTKKIRHKTKVKLGDCPEFQETFVFKVPPGKIAPVSSRDVLKLYIAEEVNNFGVRFRLYGCERMRRERMIGETVMGFASLRHDTATTHCLTLEPRSNLSVSALPMHACPI
jgi:synaptotagmin-14/16